MMTPNSSSVMSSLMLGPRCAGARRGIMSCRREVLNSIREEEGTSGDAGDRDTVGIAGMDRPVGDALGMLNVGDPTGMGETGGCCRRSGMAEIEQTDSRRRVRAESCRTSSMLMKRCSAGLRWPLTSTLARRSLDSSSRPARVFG